MIRQLQEQSLSPRSDSLKEIESDVTFRANRDGLFTYVSTNAATLTGYSVSELLGMHFSDLVVPRDLARVTLHYGRQLRSGLQLTHTEFAIRCKDGREKFVEQSVELVMEDDPNSVSFSSHVRDVTERTLVENELRNSELRFRTVFENSPDAIFIDSLDGKILDVNPAACELHGGTREDLIGRRITDLAAPERRELVLERYALLVEGSIDSLTGMTQSLTGKSIPVEIRASRITYGDQDAMLLHVRDISERLEAEKALKISEQTNDAIIKALPDLIFWISKDGEYLHFIARPDALLAVPREEVIGNNIKRTMPPIVYKQMIQAIAQVLKTGQLQIIRYSVEVGPKKIRCYFEARIVPAEDETVLMIVRDVSYQRLLEHQVVYAKEEERRRIGRDLHDGLGSLLTGIAMLSRGLERDAADGKVLGSKQLEQIATLAKRGVDQARALARGLNPVKLEEHGLIPALEKLAADTETISKITVTFHADDDLPAPDDATAMQVYWIAQEAITNAVKHAAARNIEVIVRRKPPGCELIVSDDGKGMPNSGKDDGVGVPIMNYRAQLIGARLSVGVSTLGGTEIRCVIPEC